MHFGVTMPILFKTYTFIMCSEIIPKKYIVCAAPTLSNWPQAIIINAFYT